MRWIPVVVASCVLSACSSGTGSTVAPPSTSSSAQPDSGTTLDIPIPCDDTVLDGIEATIRSQLAAFAARDFAGARQFASDGFQSSVSEDQFQQIIETRYAFLLAGSEVEFLECEQIDDRAQMFVRYDSSIDLRYQLIRQTEGWRIDGATRAEDTPAVEV